MDVLTRRSHIDVGGVFETSGIAGLGPTRHQDVEAAQHGRSEEVSGLLRNGAEPDEVLEVVGLDHELSKVVLPVRAADVGDDDVQPRAVGQRGVDEGELRSTRRPLVFSMRSTRSLTSSDVRILGVSSAMPPRATKTLLGS